MSQLTNHHTAASFRSSLERGDGLYIAILAVLFWLPLPLGSYQPLYSGIMVCLFSGLFLVWCIGVIFNRYHIPASFIKSWPVLLLWCLWLCYLVLQVTPLPITIVERLSPTALDWHLRGNSGATMATLSVNSYATMEAILKTLGYLLLFCMVLLLTSRSKHLRWLSYGLVFSGFFQALFGIYMAQTAQIYGFLPADYDFSGSARGTFFTRNLFAGYLVMCLSIGTGLLLGQMTASKLNSWRQRLRHFVEWILGEKIRLRVYLACMVIALVLTHSRMGNTSFFVALTLTSLASLALTWHAPRAMIILVISLFAIDVLILGAWFGLDKLANRLNSTKIGEHYRVQLDESTFRYWQDYPLTGSGLGSFKEHYTSYMAEEIRPDFHYAHNDYLQMGAEVGIVGLVLLGLPVALTLYFVLRGLYRRKRPLIQGALFGVTMSVVALTLHSIVDYNLQMPSNAATFMAILAMGLAAAHLPSRTLAAQTGSAGWRPRTNLAKGSIALLATSTGLLFVTSLLWSQSSVNLEEVRALSSNAEFQAAESKLARMLRTNPGNPTLEEELGVLHSQKANRSKLTLEEVKINYQQALAAFERAVRLQPVDANTWANIVRIKAYLQQYDSSLFSAMDNAIAAGPWRPYPVNSVTETGLFLWETLADKNRTLVIHALNKSLLIEPEKAKQWYDRMQQPHNLCSYSGKSEALVELCLR